MLFLVWWKVYLTIRGRKTFLSLLIDWRKKFWYLKKFQDLKPFWSKKFKVLAEEKDDAHCYKEYFLVRKFKFNYQLNIWSFELKTLKSKDFQFDFWRKNSNIWLILLLWTAYFLRENSNVRVGKFFDKIEL